MQVNTTRGFLWSDVETRTLLNIWGEQDIQTALDGSFRNSFVYRDVARRLAAMGFDRTPEQCRVRVKSLKRQFLLAKEGNIRNNGQYHKICKFYDMMERILSNRPVLDPQDMLEGGPGEETVDGLDEDGEDAQDAYSESTGDCRFPAETEVKLEYPTMPIPIPVKVTVGNTSTPPVRPQNSSQQGNHLPARTPKRPRKRRANFPLEKLMEQFLEQSAQAEENFYRVEEQRLQAEDHRREAEHTRELQMLQMLGQMFSNISTRPSSGFSSPTPTCTQGPSSHNRHSSPQADSLKQHSQLLNLDSQPLGSSFSVILEALKQNFLVFCNKGIFNECAKLNGK